MRTVLQRVTSAVVTVDDHIVGRISEGLVIFLGIKGSDTDADLLWLADKIIHLRIFEDDQGKMNRSLIDIDGEVLIISQFTLYGDCRKGRRPGFSTAAPPDKAEPLYQKFIDTVQSKGITTASGVFQAEMQVELINNGPVTLMLDSEKTF